METATQSHIKVERSLTGRAWHLAECDSRMSLALQQRFSLHAICANILGARNITIEEAGHFLNPTLRESLPDPMHLRDMALASERIASAIVSGEKVAVFGDYDVDGATSSALLLRYFRLVGQDLRLYVPDRLTEGYGPNTLAFDRLKREGISLVISVDCGTLAFEPLEHAHQNGLDVIVLDHHQSEARLPRAYAVVNPNRLDETSPHRGLAAVGVTFLTLVAVQQGLRAAGFFANRLQPDLLKLLDIVALGTVCDVVPLLGANRAFVAQGLKICAQRGNAGLAALFDIAKVNEQPSAYHLGFLVGPRVNAGGRVGKAALGAQLLATDDPIEAKMLAEELNNYNDERRAIEALVYEEALAQAEAQADRHAVLLLSGEHWHPGVLGIVAGRLKERFEKPVAVATFLQGMGKASARSVSGFDFGATVISGVAEGVFPSGGGHAMAAGFALEARKLAEVHAYLNARALAAFAGRPPTRSLKLDGAISVGGATPELAQFLEQLGPFGAGNPSPRLLLEDARVLEADIVGNDHVRLWITDANGAGRRKNAMAFRAGSTALGKALLGARGKRMHFACNLRAQIWQGQPRVSVTIEDAAFVE